MIFDTHIHLNSEPLINDLSINLKEAIDAGVNCFLCVGYDYASSLIAVEIANKYKNVYAAIGVIPTEYKSWNDNSYMWIEDLLRNDTKKRIKAIGEIGLDYYWEKETSIINKEKEMFIKQIEIANKFNLPVSIHCRDAFQDCYNILKEYPVNNKGILHCFSGSLEMAKEFIKLGYKIAFGGVLTFKNSKLSKEVLKGIKLEDIVLETDAPYLAPVPYRGKVNLPKYIKETAIYAAELLNMDLKQFEEIVYKNSLDILHVEIKYEI